MEMFLTSFVLQFDWMLCDSITSSGWTLCASVVDIDFSFLAVKVCWLPTFGRFGRSKFCPLPSVCGK